MIKSKKLQYLFLISGVVLSFVSSEVKASSVTEEAFLPVQGYLIREHTLNESEEDHTSVDDTVPIYTASTVLKQLPQTGGQENKALLYSGIVLISMLLVLRLRRGKLEEM